jgi:hypothetical protein
MQGTSAGTLLATARRAQVWHMHSTSEVQFRTWRECCKCLLLGTTDTAATCPCAAMIDTFSI